MATEIDYNKVLSRFAAYKASDFKDMLRLSRELSNGIYDKVTQANTDGCQCSLWQDDIITNFVEKKVVGDLVNMFPPGTTDREIVDELYLGGTSIATLIHRASDDQWDSVINGRGRRLALRIFHAIGGPKDYYDIRLINTVTGNILQGYVTDTISSPYIEDYLRRTCSGHLTVWYGHEDDHEMKSLSFPL